MTEVQTEFGAFRRRTEKRNEKTDFSVISGDFNIDNISPGKLHKIIFEAFFGYKWAYEKSETKEIQT
jgi:hypothetical protein